MNNERNWTPNLWLGVRISLSRLQNNKSCNMYRFPVYILRKEGMRDRPIADPKM